MSVEPERALFEAAQERRTRTAVRRRMAGNCSRCWKRPRRQLGRKWRRGESLCRECHNKAERERYAKRMAAKRNAPRVTPLPGVNPAYDPALQA